MANLDDIRKELIKSREQEREKLDQEKANNSDLKRSLDELVKSGKGGSEIAERIRNEMEQSNESIRQTNNELDYLNERLPLSIGEKFKDALVGFLGVDFMEKFTKIASGIQQVGDSIVGKLDSMVVSPVKGLLDGFFDAIKIYNNFKILFK